MNTGENSTGNENTTPAAEEAKNETAASDQDTGAQKAEGNTLPPQDELKEQGEKTAEDFAEKKEEEAPGRSIGQDEEEKE